MYFHSYCAAIQGIDAHIISVEVDVCDGLPMFSLVGLLSSETREAKDRVRISVRNSGYRIPTKHITVNLSPADIRKEGTAFDFAIAVALLAAFGRIPQECLENAMFIGELSLNGEIKRVNGVLPMVYAAKKNRMKYCFVARENVAEAAMVEGIKVKGVKNLKEVVEYFTLDRKIATTTVTAFAEQIEERMEDFSEVSGQEMVKRALEIGVCGMHNVLMVGPPGAGKTMLAKRIPSIMPELTFEESLEISKIYSISGLLDENYAYIKKRPFRSPHHSVTPTSLIGGGYHVKPGEVCLADGGVLFLDELPEFSSNTIDMLRQPLEEHKVVISRMQGSYTFPAKFMLVAAMNPCKCGFYPDRNRCRCSERQVRGYLNKISRPLLDRIDLSVEAMEVTYKDLIQKGKAESSCEIRKRIKKARKIQEERYYQEEVRYNGQLSAKQVEKYCVLGKQEQKMMEQIFETMELSARGYHKILKVARTIADLEGSERILDVHLSEAVCYRGFDKKYWGD
ncbi:mg chelatase subunit ChlI [Clostridium sp. CAG:411]|jgi:magnesium chelatase family protein|nr:YifB family Mg chelatase-like AAA ATPase [Lachnospiraceae bacterium]CDE42908.1 mg chelatase subunit ChlI [Clostridium sp. CAG:411]